MEDSLRNAEPVALARPRGAHRLEAFSPKLARRVVFYQRTLLEQWLLLEANPTVISFCERPGYVLIDGHRHLVDFWVRYVDRAELVFVSDSKIESNAKTSSRDLDGNAFPIRRVAPAELAAACVWTDNWQRMLPYLVANRKLVPPTLPPAIARFVEQPQRLLAVEREFSTGDPVLVRTALFGLLHCGRVSAPELRTQPLSLLTSFVAAQVVP
ncbi:hypothetical protein B0G57_1128 [Trinickia symbiotica]|uniref:TnsA endonuclease N-terminal domain-containing protein n=1 Tax=Trinickia symbiotica TaxID=863227 RepID=A0A2N7WZQ7_9BURK|nr:hypothetical protein [Trinickia symbiotica]PMS34976.1 hypothetical protein C0Z20_19660 [Trinickia symbiotica]PPK43461.1 hypothetical protein B0G57_1128 [Trinickia symbiotica]